MSRPRKLTDAQAAYIRTVLAARRALPSPTELAKRFGVPLTTIHHIEKGNTYKIHHKYQSVKV